MNRRILYAFLIAAATAALAFSVPMNGLGYSGHAAVALAVFAIGVAMACSLSFMTPLADPTVTIAHGTRYVDVKQIFKAGLLAASIGLVLTVVVLLTVVAPLLGS